MIGLIFAKRGRKKLPCRHECVYTFHGRGVLNINTLGTFNLHKQLPYFKNKSSAVFLLLLLNLLKVHW
jgi:hypothetical protein